MSVNNLIENLLSPLSDVTRKQRTALLAVCLLSILIIHLGIYPKEIPGIGISLENEKESIIHIILLIGIFYFLLSFWVYSRADYAKWKFTDIDSKLLYLKSYIKNAIVASEGSRSTDEKKVEKSQDLLIMNKYYEKLTHKVLFIARIRSFVDFYLPYFVALYSIVGILVKIFH